MSEPRFLDELEAELQRVAGQRARRRPGRRAFRLAAPALAVAAVLAVVLGLTGNGNPGPSLLSRAYAATSSARQILFYKATTHNIPGGDTSNQPTVPLNSADSVWSFGNTVRVTSIITNGTPGQNDALLLSGESVTSGDRSSDWTSTPGDAAGTVVNSTQSTAPVSCANVDTALSSTTGCGTPLEAVRALYRSGALHLETTATFHGRNVDVLSNQTSHPRAGANLTRVLVDATTLTPVEEIETFSNFTAITTFSAFARLPLTAANSRLLHMSAHPGAAVRYLPPGGLITIGASTTSSTSTSGANKTVLGEIQLINEMHTGAYASTTAVADLIRAQGQHRLVITTRGLPRPAPGTAYGLWLLHTTTGARTFLGYLAGQPHNRRTNTETALPQSAVLPHSSLELTIEPGHRTPSRPGKVVLHGTIP